MYGWQTAGKKKAPCGAFFGIRSAIAYLYCLPRKERLIFAQLPDAATRPALAKKREELWESLDLLGETLARFED